MKGREGKTLENYKDYKVEGLQDEMNIEESVGCE